MELKVSWLARLSGQFPIHGSAFRRHGGVLGPIRLHHGERARLGSPDVPLKKPKFLLQRTRHRGTQIAKPPSDGVSKSRLAVFEQAATSPVSSFCDSQKTKGAGQAEDVQGTEGRQKREDSRATRFYGSFTRRLT